MRFRVFVILAVLSLAGAPALAQQPGQIFGKIVDASGAVMPA